MADILSFPSKPKADIAAEARSFADKIEAGEFDRVDTVLVISSGKYLQCHYWGNELDVVEAIGVLETAKANLVRRLIG